LRIVSNTSPIVALDHLGELDLLRKIFGSAILIPPAVSRELAGLIPSIRPRLEALRSLPFHISPRLQEDVLTQARE
jgi:predicted nucleic acid-binding protein